MLRLHSTLSDLSSIGGKAVSTHAFNIRLPSVDNSVWVPSGLLVYGTSSFKGGSRLANFQGLWNTPFC